MLIRDARLGDLEALLQLLAVDTIREVDEDLSDLTPYTAALEEILASDHSTVLVGELDGRLVATAQVTWLRRMMYGGGLVCQIESVRVSPELRSGGLGGRLVGWILDDARARGCARVELTSNARRVDARRFYERLGFTASHVGMKLYLGGSHDCSAPCPGRLSARFRGGDQALLRGPDRPDGGPEAAGAGEAWRRVVPRRGL